MGYTSRATNPRKANPNPPNPIPSPIPNRGPNHPSLPIHPNLPIRHARPIHARPTRRGTRHHSMHRREMKS